MSEQTHVRHKETYICHKDTWRIHKCDMTHTSHEVNVSDETYIRQNSDEDMPKIDLHMPQRNLYTPQRDQDTPKRNLYMPQRHVTYSLTRHDSHITWVQYVRRDLYTPKKRPLYAKKKPVYAAKTFDVFTCAIWLTSCEVNVRSVRTDLPTPKRDVGMPQGHVTYSHTRHDSHVTWVEDIRRDLRQIEAYAWLKDTWSWRTYEWVMSHVHSLCRG